MAYVSPSNLSQHFASWYEWYIYMVLFFPFCLSHTMYSMSIFPNNSSHVRAFGYEFTPIRTDNNINTCLDQLIRDLFSLNQRSRVRALETKQCVLGEIFLNRGLTRLESGLVRSKMDFRNRIWLTKKKKTDNDIYYS